MSSQIKTVSATQAQNQLSELLHSAYTQLEHVIIERDGIPVAVLLPIQDYQRLLDMDEANIEELSQHIDPIMARDVLRAFLIDSHRKLPDVADDEIDADIAEAIKIVRQAG